MKHKHYDTIVAWAADTSKVVQVRDPRITHKEYWMDVLYNNPQWNPDEQYRIKPDGPKPDRVEYWLHDPKLRLTFDGETNKLKSVEVL